MGGFSERYYSIELWETHVLCLRLSLNFWCTRVAAAAAACEGESAPTGTERESESTSRDAHTHAHRRKHTRIWRSARQESDWSESLSRSSLKLAQLASAALSKAWRPERERERAKDERARDECKAQRREAESEWQRPDRTGRVALVFVLQRFILSKQAAHLAYA